jgi:hypothetical protein
MHVACSIRFLDLQWVYESVHPLILPSPSRRHVLKEVVLVRMVRHRFHYLVHRRLLHHASDRLQAYESLLDGIRHQVCYHGGL